MNPDLNSKLTSKSNPNSEPSPSATGKLDFWDPFYSKGFKVHQPSSFAEFVLPHIQVQRNHKKFPKLKDAFLVDCGCGNARDTFFFHSQHIPSFGVDLSESAIKSASAHASTLSSTPSIHFSTNNFAQLDTNKLLKNNTGFAYFRFTLHSCDRNTADTAVKWACQALMDGGLLLIEVRSVLGEMYACGTVAPPLTDGADPDPDAKIYGHYRRFVRKQDLLKLVLAQGLELEYLNEDKGLSIYKNDDPVVIRLIASKNNQLLIPDHSETLDIIANK